MLRILLILLALIAVIIGGGVFYIASQGKTLIRQGVTDYGPQVTGTPVSLDDVSFNLFGGSARLDGFTIGSPDGYSAEQSFSVGALSISLKPMSVTSDTLHITDISIDAPKIFLEPKLNGATNLQTIQNNINAFTGPAESSSSGSSQKIIVERLAITDTVLGFVGENIGLGDQQLELPDIVLTDIGIDENGVPPGKLVQLVSDALMPEVQKILVSQKGKELLQQALGDRLGVDVQGDLREQVEEKAKNAVGNLLNRRRNPDQ